MRRLSIVLACAVFASQACLAGSPHGQRFDLGRRNTTVEQFQQDRDDCTAKIVASLRRHSSRAARRNICQSNPNSSPPNPGYVAQMSITSTMDRPSPDSYSRSDAGVPNRYFYADGLFIECMRAKGYTRVPESTGFRAGPLWR